MEQIVEIINRINKGEVGVLPTDTLYGLVAKASNQNAVKKLYDIKSRKDKPGTLIAANINQLVELGFKRRYLTVVEKYWPGAISVVIPLGKTLNYLHQGKQSLAVRIPDKLKLLKILIKTGPLLTSSANLPGQRPAKNIDQAKKYFGKSVDYYVDDGALDNQPSTVIRVVDDTIEVLRKGKVKIDETTGRIIK